MEVLESVLILSQCPLGVHPLAINYWAYKERVVVIFEPI